MKSCLSASLFAVSGILGSGCGGLDTSLTNWSLELLSPRDDAGRVPFCPSIVKAQTAYVAGNSGLRDEHMVAPLNVVTSVTVQDEDIYAAIPSFTDPVASGAFGFDAMVFDIGPIGTLYTAAPTSTYLIPQDLNDVTGIPMTTTVIDADGEPAFELNVTRTFLDGRTESSKSVDIRYEYAPHCSEITVHEANVPTNTTTCTCETQTLTWRLTGT